MRYERITTVNGFKRCVNAWLKKSNPKENESRFCISLKKHLFYRGESKEHDSIRPRIFRTELAKRESSVLKAAASKFREYFPNCDSALNELIIMHNIGLDTRLLDVTTDPLVVLYFACCDNPNEDGYVYFGDFDSCENNYETAMLTAEQLFNFNSNKSYEEKINKATKNYGINREQLTKPLIIKDPSGSKTLAAQKTAFLMPPLFQADTNGIKQCSDYNFLNNKIFTKWNRVKIKHNSKTNILKQLSELGITENALFPNNKFKS